MLFLDPTNGQQIVRKNGVALISNLLKNTNDDIILNVITSLIFLKENPCFNDMPDAIASSIFKEIKFLEQSTRNLRIRNLATIFLEDVAKSNSHKEGGGG